MLGKGYILSLSVNSKPPIFVLLCLILMRVYLNKRPGFCFERFTALIVLGFVLGLCQVLDLSSIKGQHSLLRQGLVLVLGFG